MPQQHKTLSPISKARNSSPININLVSRGQDQNLTLPTIRIPSSLSPTRTSSSSLSSFKSSSTSSLLKKSTNSHNKLITNSTSNNNNTSHHFKETKKNLSPIKKNSSPTKVLNLPQKQQSSNTDKNAIWRVEKVLGKKKYKGRIYYKLKWANSNDVTWVIDKNCECDNLISNYEKSCEDGTNDEDENEWEVEKILDKRVKKDQTEYLIQWKGWPGEPTWEKAEDCHCINLVAAFENPKLKKMWNFQGSNLTLWIKQLDILQYMDKFKKGVEYKVSILKYEPDFPEKERQVLAHQGLNIGPLCYENHWYLVIILVNHICVTRKILVGDSLNTLIGSNIKTHPVIRRLTRMYPQWPIKPVRLTQMDRSDMCAFCILAAYERALFLYHPHSQFIVENIFYDLSRAELIRHHIKPETHGEITVSLPTPDCFNNGPTCEFCNKVFGTSLLVDEHINSEHIIKPQKKEKKTKEFLQTQ